jgi:hypothetical protein
MMIIISLVGAFVGPTGRGDLLRYFFSNVLAF